MSGRSLSRRARGLAALLVVALSACSAKIPVTVDAASRTTLAGYRTFAWMDPPPDPKPAAIDPTVQAFDRHLRTAADNILAGKGYLRNNSAPDMLVLLRTRIEERYSETIGDYWRYRDAGGPQPLFNAFSLGYEMATVTVEAYDAASRVLLWRGHTAVAMDAPRRDARAVASIAELLATFPRQQG